MKIDITSTGDFQDTIYWLKQLSKKDFSSPLNGLGREGVQALKMATPVGESGDTANGWKYEIEHKGRNTELSFINTAHPEAQVNVAILIDVGHSTGTGGYVAPKPYIKQAMDDVFQKSSNLITEELMK